MQTDFSQGIILYPHIVHGKTVNFPDPFLQPCKDLYWGMFCHMAGGEALQYAEIYYSTAGGMSCNKKDSSKAGKYLEWLHEKREIQYVVSPGNIKDHTLVAEFLKKLCISGQPLSEPQRRGLDMLVEYSRQYDKQIRHLWLSIKTVYDALDFGVPFEQLRKSVSDIGVLHNVLDKYGLPIPAQLRERQPQEAAGWSDIKGVRFLRGEVSIIGGNPGPLAPLVTQEDIDVALWLAFMEDSAPCGPSFSLEEADLRPHTECRINEKVFSPRWLGRTSFGQTMFFTDWLMKAFCMRRGLPSVTHPLLSGDVIEEWQPTAIMTAIADADGRSTLPDGSDANFGRLMISLRGVRLNKAVYPSEGFRTLEYELLSADLFVESSLGKQLPSGADEHYFLNDPSTCPGARAKIITDHYDYLAVQFPAFARVKLLLALFSIFAQARRDGVRLWSAEQQRLIRDIGSKRQAWERHPKEYSPKPFHAGGCTCVGGVSGSYAATVVQTLNRPFDSRLREHNCISYPQGSVTTISDVKGSPHEGGTQSIPSSSRKNGTTGGGGQNGGGGDDQSKANNERRREPWRYAMANETTIGLLYGLPVFSTEARVGTDGYIHATINLRKHPDHKDKTTGDANGNLHHHGTHWGSIQGGKSDGHTRSKQPPGGAIFDTLYKKD